MKTSVQMILGTTICAVFISSAVRPAAAEIPDQVQSIIKRSCAVSGCHQGKFSPKKLDLTPGVFPDNARGVASREVPELKLVDPTDPDKSYLLMKVAGQEGISGKRMPIGRKALDPEEIQALRDWIKSLAEHQSDRPDPPEAARTAAGPLPGVGDEIVPASSASGAPSSGEKGGFEKPPFWGATLVNMPTTALTDKGDFLFRISHRYIPSIKSGYDSFYGLDGPSFIFLSIGYGLSSKMALTIGRSRMDQEVELGLDWLLFEQGGNSGVPFSAVLHTGGGLLTQGRTGHDLFDSHNFRLNVQLSLSRQISERLSLLLVPSLCSNANSWASDRKGVLALGLGGRFMLFGDVSLIGEWIPVLSGYKSEDTGWGLGIEKKAGGHVFQFFVLNSVGLTPGQYLPGGDLPLEKQWFRLGFNIYRSF